MCRLPAVTRMSMAAGGSGGQCSFADQARPIDSNRPVLQTKVASNVSAGATRMPSGV